MEPNSVIAQLQTLLAGGGNIGQRGGMVPPIVKPAIPSMPTGQAPPSILPRKAGQPGNSPMDVRPAAAGGPGLASPPSAAAAPSSSGGAPSIFDKVGRYGSAASGGMGAVSPNASPMQAFGEALFGAMKSRRDTKAGEAATAYERDWKEGERTYQHGRDSKADERAAAAEGRAASETAYKHGRDTVEDQRNATKDARDARNDEFGNLKTAAEIESVRNGKPMSDQDVEEIIAKRYGPGSFAPPEEIDAERARLKSLGRQGGGKDAERAPTILGSGERPNNKGDRGGPAIPSILPPDGAEVPAEPNTTTAQRGAPSAVAAQPKSAGTGTPHDPYMPKSLDELHATAKPGDIYADPSKIDPKTGKPQLYRYKGPPAK